MLVALVSRNLLSCEKCTDNLCLRSQASKGSAVWLNEKQGCRRQGARGKENPRFLVPCFFKQLAFRRGTIPLQNVPLPPCLFLNSIYQCLK